MASGIYEAIPMILSDVEAIEKNRRNQSQGFNFRGIDDVMNTLHPLFAKHKVFPTCQFSDVTRSERETKSGGTMFCVTLKAKYTLYASDGSSVSTEAVGEGMDTADKATNKAMSACYKYAMFQLLCIPTEAVDADAETPEPVKPSAKRDIDADLAKRQAAEDALIAELAAKIDTHKGYYEALKKVGVEIGKENEQGSGRFKALVQSKLKPALTAAIDEAKAKQSATNAA